VERRFCLILLLFSIDQQSYRLFVQIKKIVASLARLLDDTLDYLMMENHISSGCYLLPQPTKAALFCSVESGLDELARRTNWESSLLRLYVPLATCKRFPAVARKS
jgi:hypothetical protein